MNLTKSLTDRLRVGLQLFAAGPRPHRELRHQGRLVLPRLPLTNWLGRPGGARQDPLRPLQRQRTTSTRRASPSSSPSRSTRRRTATTCSPRPGGEVYGYAAHERPRGRSTTAPIGGTIFLDTTQPRRDLCSSRASTSLPRRAGGLLWETPVEGLRVGGSVQALRLDATVVPTSQPSTARGGRRRRPRHRRASRCPPCSGSRPPSTSARDLLLAAEYSRWYLSESSSNPAVFPASPTMISERGLRDGDVPRQQVAPARGLLLGHVPERASDRSGRAERRSTTWRRRCASTSTPSGS